MRIALASFAFLLAAQAHAGDGTFEVVTAGAVGEVGAAAHANVTIKAKQGWHLNHDGVGLDKAKLGRQDLALDGETEARFDVGLTLSEPGKKVIEGVAGFVLCREDACRPIKEKVTLAVEASAGKATPAKKPTKKPTKKR
jgi:hypothetical protein